MPLLKSKPAKPDPDKVYTAWDGFAWENDVIAKGTRLRGDSRVVQNVFSLFVEDGTPEHEWPSPFDHVVAIQETEEAERRAKEEAAYEEAARRNKLKLGVADVMRCKEDFRWWVDGQPAYILKGSQALATDPLVVEHPEHWAPR